jgi:hypothetical protein
MWRGAGLENTLVAQLVKMVPTFYATRTTIIMSQGNIVGVYRVQIVPVRIVSSSVFNVY